ncbi:MAG TPA: RagB/SusD family nutrient uptake outer membrane protein [Puia sp.]|nr:RagB/SusD family nutrient uptake outer membrane protein [Puia sp.]
MIHKRSRLWLLYSGLCVAILLGACKKNFIDGIQPTNSASAKDVFASADAVRVYFTGIYRTVRSQWISTDGSAGGASTDVWGYNAVFLARDVKGKDIVMPYNSWYYFDYQHDNREPTYRRTKFVWYFFYELINQVNVLIAGTTNSASIDAADKKSLIAEARALRAWFYFELAREFQLSYGKNPNALGIPIYTTPASDTTRGNPRGTLQQTFDQINTDIAYAVQNIGTTQILKDQVNTSVAWGMAARIYLEQGKWADAETAAKNAIQGHSLDAAGYPDNYNGLTSPEVIWGFPQTTQNGGQSLYYGTPSSFFEKSGQGYDAFYMSEELVNTFAATDVRNTFYVYDPDPTQPDYLASNKFGTADGSGGEAQMLNGSIQSIKVTDFNESLNMMRVGEMYLIEAEAKARQSEADAGTVLFALQSNRDPAAVKSGNTGQALINEILLERRKELYGELGIDFLDAKRLQLPIDRTGSNHAPPNNFVIPANDPRFNLKIPQSELQANKSFLASDQNP